MLTRAQSFYRAMYNRPDLDFLTFSFVGLFVCLCVGITSSIYELESDSSAHIFRYHSKFFEEVLRRSIHLVHEGFSGRSRGKQCSFMRLIALLTTETIPVIEWNSTTIDNALVQGDNMYFNVLNNDLIFPRKGFLSLNNLPTVVCCRQVLRNTDTVSGRRPRTGVNLPSNFIN